MTDEIRIIQGWKGKGKIEIFSKPEEYIIIEKRKSKETGEIYDDIHKIPRSNVEIMKRIIRSLDTGTKYGYKYLVRKVIRHYGIADIEGVPEEVMMSAFNGGIFRAKYYFPYFYYPLKVLESEGYIAYLGRGGIIRLA